MVDPPRQWKEKRALLQGNSKIAAVAGAPSCPQGFKSQVEI